MGLRCAATQTALQVGRKAGAVERCLGSPFCLPIRGLGTDPSLGPVLVAKGSLPPEIPVACE